MSINSGAIRKAGPFSGNGSQTSFPFTFKVFQASDLYVVLTNTSGTETVQTLTSQYTVSLNSNQDSNPGGSVVMVTAPPSGYLLTLGSQVPQTQALTLTNTGGFYPTVLNDEFDKVTILIQQLNEQVSRAVKVGFSSSITPDTLLQYVTTLYNNITALQAIASDLTNINTVAGNTTNINTVAAANTNVTNVGSNITNVNTVAGISANVTSVAGNATNINTVAAANTNVNTVATNIAAVNTNATNIVAIQNASTNATNAASSASAASTSATNAASSATAASGSATSALSYLNSFKGQYYGALSTDPTLDPLGAAMTAGDLYFNTTTNTLRTYTGSAWVDTGAAAPITITLQRFSGTGSQTAFTLSSSPAFQNALEVFIGGVAQVAGVDFTVSGTTVTFTTAPVSGANNIFARWMSPIAAGVPNDGSVTPAKLSTGGPNWNASGLAKLTYAYYNSNTVSALDYTNGSNQRWAPSGTVTLSVANWPATGSLGELLIEGVNLGAATITWPTINWVKSDGTTTTTIGSAGFTLQSSGTDFVLLWTRDGGTTVYGKVVR